MRVLLCAPNDGHSNIYLERAFKALGHEVEFVDYRHGMPGWLDYRNTMPGWLTVEAPNMVAQSGRSDLTLILKGEIFSPALLRRLKNCILWNFDCLTEDAMVLTREGLKSHQDLRLGDIIYSYDYEKGRLVEDIIRAIPTYDVIDQEMVKIESKTNRMILTPNHRVLLSTGSRWKYSTADNVPPHFKVPVTAECNLGQPSGLSSDQIRLLAWAITEGQMVSDHHQEVKSGPRTGRLIHIRATIRITQSSVNEEKAARIRGLLDRSGIRYCVSTYGPRLIRGYKGKMYHQAKAYTFILNADDASLYLQILQGEKRIPRVLLTASREEQRLLLTEMVMGDGSTRVRGKAVYCTSDLELALQVVELAFKAGFSPGLSKEEHGWKIRLSTGNVGSSFGRVNIEKIRYTGKVFCLTTFTGNFVAFQGKRLFVTGNCWYNEAPLLREQIKAVDHFLTPSVGIFEGSNVHYMAEAADPELHRPVYPTEGEYSADVSFVGTVESVPGRDEWLAKIGKWCDENNKVLKILGSFPGEKSRKWHTGKRAGNGGNEDMEHNYIVSTSKINLDRQRNPEIEGAISARVFRTLAAQGCLLSLYMKGIEKLFTPGVHLETFADTEECLRKIELLLGDEEKRRRLALEGRREVLAHHKWTDRVEQILKLV